MSSFASVMLVNKARTQVLLVRPLHGHQMWALPSYHVLSHHDYLTEVLPEVLSGAGIILPPEQVVEQAWPVAWLYASHENPYQIGDLLVLSLLTVDPDSMMMRDMVAVECRFWPVYQLPEHILTDHALAILKVLCAAYCNALPLDMRRARINAALPAGRKMLFLSTGSRDDLEQRAQRMTLTFGIDVQLHDIQAVNADVPWAFSIPYDADQELFLTELFALPTDAKGYHS